MGRNRGRILSLPVLSVISLMAFIYYTTVFIFLDGWLALSSSAGLLNAAAFTFFAFNSVVSFFASVLTDPGGVPSWFAPETEDPQKNQGTRSRYCDKCCCHKPPRTHHCKVCKRCVLKMDHHCVWINNCVGYANYKSFIIFVLHAAIVSIYSMVIFISNIFQKEHDFEGLSHKLFYILTGAVIVGVCLSTNTLLGWHLYLLTHNLTTIEYREGVRAKWLAKKSGQNYRHPFDHGAFGNLNSILGPNVLKWLCPLATGHLNDGTQFPISNN